MRKVWLGLVVLGLLVPVSSFSKDFKIGYVNVMEVFDKYDKTKSYDESLEKIKLEKEEVLKKKKEEIDQIQSKLNLLKEEEREKKQKELAAAIEEYKNSERDIYTDLKKVRDEKMSEILKDLNDVITEYAKKNKFDLVLNENAVLYGAETMTITSEISKFMNERYKK